MKGSFSSAAVVEMGRLRWLLAASLVAFLVSWLGPAFHFLPTGAFRLPLHSFAEALSIAVSALIFGIGWNNAGKGQPRSLVILACAFLGVALLDFAHFMSYPGMPVFVTPNSAHKAIEFSLAARMLAACALLAAVWMPGRTLSHPRARFLLLGAVLAATVGMYWVILFHDRAVPIAIMVGGRLAPFKLAGLYAVIGVHVATAILLLRLPREAPRPLRAPDLLAAVLLMILSELSFTTGSPVSGTLNMLGHVFRILAYALLYRAVFVEGVREPHRQLSAAYDLQRALKDIFQTSLEPLSLDGLLERSLGTILSLPWQGQAAGAIFLADDGGGSMTVGAQRGLPASILAHCSTTSREACRAQCAAKKARAEGVDAPALDPPCLADAVAPMHLCTPIAVGDKALGVIHVELSEGTIEPERLQAVQAVADLLAQIMQRIRAQSLCQQWARIVDDSLNEIFLFDSQDWRIVQANRSTCDTLGYTIDELRALTPLNLMPSVSRDAFARILAPLTAGSQTQSAFDTFCRRRNGSLFPIAVKIHRAHSGASPIFLAIVEDLSRQDRSTQALREQMHLTHTLVEAIPYPICLKDVEGKILGVNGAYEAFFGIDRESVIGQNAFQVFPTDERFAAARHASDLASLREHGTRTRELSLRNAQGEMRHTLYTQALLTSSQGERRGIIAIMADITERKRSEQSLRESEARLRAMSANMPGMVFQAVLHPATGLSFSYVSAGAQWVCGLAPETIVDDSRAFLATLLPDAQASFEESMRRSARELGAWNWEGELNAPHGPKWVNLRASPRRVSEDTVLWDGVLLNITDSKLSEIRLRESENQLQELSAYLQSVREEEKARIAHEIHDELGGVLTALKMDLYWVGRRLPADGALISEKVEEMSRLVDSAVSTTRRISTDLRPTVLDDLGLIAALEWQVAEFARRTDIACDIATPPEDIEFGPDYPIALFRILQESLTNIARHAKATQVHVCLKATDELLLMDIRDNGIGISTDGLANSPSHGVRGMLARAAHLGGSVAIAPAPDGGTVVAVRLPRPRMQA
ncbi:MAG: PAS domain S-box protein [Betaproteobacteria bacterium]|nr:PAS domain S-box protein [Betaproteobacteria bacterium]